MDILRGRAAASMHSLAGSIQSPWLAATRLTQALLLQMISLMAQSEEDDVSLALR